MSFALPAINYHLTGGSFTTLREVAKYRKYRTKPVNILFKQAPNFDYVSLINYSLYLQIVPSSIKDKLLSIYYNSLYCQNRSQLVDYLSQVGDYVKQKRSEFDTNWLYFIDLKTLTGYNYEPMDDFDVVSETQAWVSYKKGYTVNNSSTVWSSLFRIHVRKCLGKFGGMLPRYMFTLRDFINDPDRWGTGGATHYKLGKDDSGQRIPRTKTSMAYITDPNEVYYNVLQGNITVNKVVEKRDELGKKRLIITANDNMYLCMAYVSYFLESILSNTPSLVFTYSSEKLLEMWDRLSVNSMYTNLPLDQSHFDQQKSLEYVLIICDEIEKFLEMWSLPNDVYTCMRRIKFGHMFGVVTHKGQSIPIQGGILSGWRWTALYDSIGNYCDVTIARELLGINLLSHESMGDDSAVVCYDHIDAQKIVTLMQAMGIEINRHKFWISKFDNEFLRKLIHYGKQVVSYPARMVSRICWRSPLKPAVRADKSLPFEILDNWLALHRRLIPMTVILPHLIRDISRGTNVKSSIIVNWLCTSRNLGGGGLWLGGSVAAMVVEAEPKALKVEYKGLAYSAERYGVKIPKMPLQTGRISTLFVKVNAPTQFLTRVDDRPDFRKWKYTVKLPQVTLQSEYISRLIHEKAFDTLRDVCSEEVLHIFDILYRRASRNVFYSWLKGDIEYKCVIPTLGNTLAAHILESYASMYFYKLLNRSKITKSKLLNSQIMVERVIHMSSLINWHIPYNHDV